MTRKHNVKKVRSTSNYPARLLARGLTKNQARMSDHRLSDGKMGSDKR